MKGTTKDIAVAFSIGIITKAEKYNSIEGKFKTALEELEPLADQGNIEAQFTVGLIYMQLKGYGQAEELLKKADSAGHPEASYYIGILYRNGLNVGLKR